MKIPSVFVPDKDLETKTEELKKGYREISSEELMGNNMRILHGDAENNQRIRNLEYIASNIIKDTLSDMIKWEEDIVPDPDYSKCYRAKATIPNYKEDLIIIPVTFLIRESKNIGKFGYLHLGDEEGFELKSFVGSERIGDLIRYFDKK
jgi:hypothetical protein